MITRLGDHVVEENRRVPYETIKDEDITVMSLSSKEGILTPHIGIERKTAFLKEVRHNNLVFNPRRLDIGGIALFKGGDRQQFVPPSYRTINCKESLLPDYLFLVLRTKPLRESIMELMNRESKSYLSFSSFQEILIPLPPLDVQQEIVNEHNEILLEINQIEHQIYCIDNIMEDEIITSLGILTHNIRKPKLINELKLSKIHSWFVPQLLNELKIRNIFNTKTFPRRPLTEFMEINPLAEEEINLQDKPIPYVASNDISRDIGEIEKYQYKLTYSSKNNSKIWNGDILLAKKLDGLKDGKVAIVNFQKHLVGCVSSDFFVLRNRDNSTISTSYVHYLLRSKTFRTNIRGANTRLSIGDLKSIELPVIPKEAQTSLVQKLGILSNRKKKLVRQISFLRENTKEKELLRKLFFIEEK